MKTKLGVKELGILIALFFGIFVSSCTKEEPLMAPESENYALKSAADPQPGDMVCDLTAGQTINVGQVVYSYSGGNLLVDYVTTGDWILSEVHFYVGTLGNFKETCMNKKAIQIGKFPYSATNINSTTHSFTRSLAGITPDADGYMVVAHAVVKKPGQEETAFANCTYKPLITFKTYFDANKQEYAVMKGSSVSTTSWCSFWGTNVYSEGESYELIDEDGVVKGLVTTNEDDESILITVTPNPPLIMYNRYLFVGNFTDFINTYSSDFDGCPDWHLFPYKYSDPVSTYTFIVPKLSMKNFSFSTIGANRWGWYSYYSF